MALYGIQKKKYNCIEIIQVVLPTVDIKVHDITI